RRPLPNMGRVVLTGNPTTGWELVDWDGIRDFG
ncbi:MAG TPA: histidine phosphatase family protein, partial [Mycobacterium sp.]|nr:histidine phosphatase family protein [Mycobacterium sp.]